MDENLNAVDDAQLGTVDQAQTEQAETNVNPESVNNAVPAEQQQTEDKPIQTAEQNKVYADMRRRAEAEAQKTIDTEYDRLYGQQYNIHSKADYDNYLKNIQIQQEAQQRGIDPQIYSEFQSMKNRVEGFERENTLLKQDSELSNNPQYGTLYNQWKDDVHKAANAYNCDYDTAFTLLLRDKVPDLLGKTKADTEQETISKIKNNGVTSPGSLSGESQGKQTSISNMPDKDFKALYERVLREGHVNL